MSPRLDQWLARLCAVFTKPALDADFDAELAHYLELKTADNIKAGMTPDEAGRQARIALGGVEQVRELHRDARSVPWLDQFISDFGYAGRRLRRERGFTVAALLIIALGVGLNTTVFSLVNTVLLRPIPFAYADRLIWITNGDPSDSNRNLSAITSQVDTWEGLRETSRALEQIEVYNPFSLLQTYRLAGTGEPETVTSVDVSPGLFGMLGMSPQLGRFFRPEDAVKNAQPRIVLSHQLWRRHYSEDPHIVGQTVQINGVSMEVIGVLPPADPFTSAFFPAVRVDLYSPLVNDNLRPYGNALSLIGRAKPGITIDAIRSDLKIAMPQIKKARPTIYEYCSANVIALHDRIAGSLERPLRFLWIAAGLVLAIMSVNLGGLLLARGAARRKELTLRCALGAGWLRIARQLLTECFALVALGSFLGGLMAWGFIRLLAVSSSVEIPLLQSLRFDGASLGFTVMLCLVTVGLCGAFPAWKLARIRELVYPLRDEGRGYSGGRQRKQARSILVIIQVALACVLVISAGLMVRSFLNLLQTDLGFQPSNLVAVRIDLMGDGSPVDYIERVLERVRAMPGVEHAAFTDCIPVERDRGWAISTFGPNDPHWAGAHIRIVTPELFAAMGTPLVAGRDFSREDSDEHPAAITYNQNPPRANSAAIIINQTLAGQLWPGKNALGRQVNVMGNFSCTVIGVAADVRHDGPDVPADNEMYLSLRQAEGGDSWDMMIRTALPVATLAADLRHALSEVDATLPLTKIRPMQDLVDRTLSSRRLLVSLISGFAFIAVGLSAIGLYGVISYLVTQQTKEIGIRMALGANSSTVQREIVRKTMKLAIQGLTLGLILAFVAGRSLRSLLYGVTVTDGMTYIAAIMTILVCALIAGYLPARRASRVDPLISLRVD